MHESPLMQYRGMLWKTPASSRGWEWNVLLSCLALPSATTFTKYTCLAALSCFLCKSSPCARGREEPVYGHDCKQNIGVCYTVFYQVPPRSLAITNQGLFFHISYFDFHRSYGFLEITALQAFCAGSLCVVYSIYFLSPKNKLRLIRALG